MHDFTVCCGLSVSFTVPDFTWQLRNNPASLSPSTFSTLCIIYDVARVCFDSCRPYKYYLCYSNTCAETTVHLRIWVSLSMDLMKCKRCQSGQRWLSVGSTSSIHSLIQSPAYLSTCVYTIDVYLYISNLVTKTILGPLSRSALPKNERFLHPFPSHLLT